MFGIGFSTKGFGEPSAPTAESCSTILGDLGSVGGHLEVSTEPERFEVLYCVDCEERFSLDTEYSVIRYMNLKHPRSSTPLTNANQLLNEGKCAWCGGKLVHEWVYRLGDLMEAHLK